MIRYILSCHSTVTVANVLTLIFWASIVKLCRISMLANCRVTPSPAQRSKTCSKHHFFIFITITLGFARRHRWALVDTLAEVGLDVEGIEAEVDFIGRLVEKMRS